MNGCAAHEDAWQKAVIAHCDISLGNIQILEGRGILADWEFGTPVSQLSTDRAINSASLAPFTALVPALTLKYREHSIPCHRGLLTIGSSHHRQRWTGQYGTKCAQYFYASFLP